MILILIIIIIVIISNNELEYANFAGYTYVRWKQTRFIQISYCATVTLYLIMDDCNKVSSVRRTRRLMCASV